MFADFVSNLVGVARRERYGGRDYLVAPVTMIVAPSILNGSKGPLLYPVDEVSRTVAAWDGMPITLDHPYLRGQPTSARTAGVLYRQGIGLVRQPKMRNGKLQAEGWFDVENCRRLAPKVLAALENGRRLELSTGVFTETEPTVGYFAGRQYEAIVRRLQPDHLAVFDNGQIGACSLRDGCGVGVNSLSQGDYTMFPRFMLDESDVFTINEDERCEDVLDIPTINYEEPGHDCNCGRQATNNRGAATAAGGAAYDNSDPDLLDIPSIIW